VLARVRQARIAEARLGRPHLDARAPDDARVRQRVHGVHVVGIAHDDDAHGLADLRRGEPETALGEERLGHVDDELADAVVDRHGLAHGAQDLRGVLHDVEDHDASRRSRRRGFMARMRAISALARSRRSRCSVRPTHEHSWHEQWSG